MSVKILLKTLFIIWMMVITVLSVIPHADDGIMVLTNVTTSGMAWGSSLRSTLSPQTYPPLEDYTD